MHNYKRFWKRPRHTANEANTNRVSPKRPGIKAIDINAMSPGNLTNYDRSKNPEGKVDEINTGGRARGY